MRQIFVIFAALVMSLPAPGSQSQDRLENIAGSVTFFYYQELGPAREFYEDILGFEKSFDLGWVMIFQITDEAAVGIVLEEKGFHQTADDKPVMLSIVTDDIEYWHDRLQASHVPFISGLDPPATKKKGEDAAPIRSFIIADPAGYTIEFFQWQKGEE